MMHESKGRHIGKALSLAVVHLFTLQLRQHPWELNLLPFMQLLQLLYISIWVSHTG